MSIKDDKPFGEIINLVSIVEDAENGDFESVRQIRKEFHKLRNTLHKYERLTIEAYQKQLNCTCEEFTKPIWTLRKNILNYYHHFEKSCKCCGKEYSIQLEDFNENVDPFPEGFEGAEKGYYNLDL